MKPLNQKNVDEGWIVVGNDKFIGADKTNVHVLRIFLILTAVTSMVCEEQW